MPDSQGSPCVPVARIEALLRLLGPGEMTPIATRMIEKVLHEYRARNDVTADGPGGRWGAG